MTNSESSEKVQSAACGGAGQGERKPSQPASEEPYLGTVDVLLKEEEAEIERRAGVGLCKGNGSSPRAALCLSGGGIRSATFSLGVLQGLARQGMLSQFAYLSTVSGGGYAGAWLTAWMRNGGGTAAVVQALAGGAEPHAVRELRRFSNYLSPKGGLSVDALALASAFLRNLVLNWLVIVPLLLALLLVPRILMGAVVELEYSRAVDSSWVLVWFSVWVVAVLAALALPLLAKCVASWPAWIRSDALLALPLVMVTLATIALGPKAKASIEGLRKGDWDPAWYVVLAPALALLSLWLAAAVGTWVRDRVDGGANTIPRYIMAYVSGHWLGLAAAWLVLALVVLKLPVWLLTLPALRSFDTGAWVGATALLGLITAAVGYWSRHGPAVERRTHTLLSTLGLKVQELLAAGFMVLLLASLCYATAYALGLANPSWKAKVERGAKTTAEQAALDRLKTEWIRRQPDREPPKQWGCRSAGLCAYPSEIAGRVYELGLVTPLDSSKDSWYGNLDRLPLLISIASALAAFGFALSWLFGVNRHSLGDIYRWRLTRAYLAASRPQRAPDPVSDTDKDDDVPLAASGDKLPFLVVNAAFNSVSDVVQHPSVRDRRAESFVMTPLGCGCESLGYVRTNMYAGGMTLGRAMAISGAAASPNMGYHTSPAVGLVLGFFNIRLGAWLPSPSIDGQQQWNLREPRSSLRALVDEWLTRPSSDSPFVNVTDGGHFDNLGLYEMVRRRCARIVVVDATCDPNYEFTDLAQTMRRIRVDMGIEIEFPHGLPGPPVPGGALGGPDARGGCVAIGRVGYLGAYERSGPDGTLYYIKPVLDDGVPQDLKDYAREARRTGRPFPQQPTWDQFFDEAQFESYRRLGLHCATVAFPGQGLWPTATHVAALRSAAFAQATAATGGQGPVGAAGAAAAAPESEGVVDRLKQFFQSMSPGEVLASAAIAGAITVTGTVTLADRRVELGSGSIQSLNEVTNAIGRVDAEMGNPATPPRGLLASIRAVSTAIDQKPSDQQPSGLLQGIAGLSAEVAKLTTLLEGVKRGSNDPSAQNPQVDRGGDISGLLESLKQLQGSVDALKNAIGPPRGGESRATLLAQLDAAREALKQVGDLSKTFAATQTAAQGLASKASDAASAVGRFEREANDAAERLKQAKLLTEAKATLEKMEEHLRKIESHVDKLPPARTIRGTPEGAGR